jgi:hypothetical protein
MMTCQHAYQRRREGSRRRCGVTPPRERGFALPLAIVETTSEKSPARSRAHRRTATGLPLVLRAVAGFQNVDDPDHESLLGLRQRLQPLRMPRRSGR